MRVYVIYLLLVSGFAHAAPCNDEATVKSLHAAVQQAAQLLTPQDKIELAQFISDYQFTTKKNEEQVTGLVQARDAIKNRVGNKEWHEYNEKIMKVRAEAARFGSMQIRKAQSVLFNFNSNGVDLREDLKQLEKSLEIQGISMDPLITRKKFGESGLYALNFAIRVGITAIYLEWPVGNPSATIYYDDGSDDIQTCTVSLQ